MGAIDKAATESDTSGHDVLSQILDLGVDMLTCGGDVNLVESCLSDLGRAYGASSVNVFAITSSLVVTMRMADGREHTRTRRIHQAMSTDFSRLERLYKLCRSCCEEPIPADELALRLAEIRHVRASAAYLYLGSMLAAGCFAVFFGGSALDGIVSAAFAVLICLMQRRFRPYCPNEIVFNFVASLVSGLGIGACARLFPVLDMDMIVIGEVMLLIPGIVITNAMRDMLTGDTMAGTLRLIDSLLWAGALAAGFMVAILVVGA